MRDEEEPQAMSPESPDPQAAASPGGDASAAAPDAGELERLRDLALGIARDAARLASARRAEGVRIAATKTTLTDIVTDADREVEALIRERLLRHRPDDGFLGEESGAVTGSTGLSWVVDPIDGTVNYFYGIHYSAVSIALVSGRPDAEPAESTALLGVVVNIFTGEAFTAILGGGAQCDGVPIRVSEPDGLSQALVITGFSYDVRARSEQGRACALLLGEVRDIRRLGAGALDLCSVAAGRADLYFERGMHPWDHAAGALIAREAGAQVTGLEGQREGERMVLAGAPHIRAAFEPLLLSAMREAGVSAIRP